MSNLEKYTNVFVRLFEIDAETAKELKYQDIDAWDSVGHMTLIAELEDAFGLDMDADDIIDFESFERGKEILAKNYKVEF